MKYRAIPILAAGLLALTLSACGGGTTAAQSETPNAGAAATPVTQTTPAAQSTPAAPTASAAQETPAAQAAAGTQTGAPAGQGRPAQTAGITEEDAKSAALSHAGLTADQVSFARVHQDWDDGRLVYDVEFYTADYEEYDYEIDASSGAVLSFDYDAEYYDRPVAPTGTSAAITADQAREIALAEVPGASASDIWEFEVDRDDGRIEYEGKIVYDGMEYEFSIDGTSGAILGWEREPIWH